MYGTHKRTMELPVDRIKLLICSSAFSFEMTAVLQPKPTRKRADTAKTAVAATSTIATIAKYKKNFLPMVRWKRVKNIFYIQQH